MFENLPVQPADIEAAAARIAPYILHTPLLRSAHLDAVTGATVLLKPENLQHTGSFKFRGATNAIMSLSPAERSRGILAWSSGNHAQAVSSSAKRLGLKATIVMPKDAPQMKINATRGYGAEVVLYDRYTESREEIGLGLAEKHGYAVIPPYDYAPTIAGQGTAGREVALEMQQAELTPDLALCPCSGGGLTAGFSIALRTIFPHIELYGVEPEDFDDTRRSLASGKLESNPPDARSICDALQSGPPGELTFAINRRLLTAAPTVSDDEALAAMAFAFRYLKLVVEPGGAVALAALLQGRVEARGKTIVVMLSGGNVDTAMYARALELVDSV